MGKKRPSFIFIRLFQPIATGFFTFDQVLTAMNEWAVVEGSILQRRPTAKNKTAVKEALFLWARQKKR